MSIANEQLLNIAMTLRRIAARNAGMLDKDATALDQAASKIETMVVDDIANAPPIVPKSTADLRTAQRLAGALALLEAVQFYADPATYFAIGVRGDHPCGDFLRDTAALSDDDKTIWDDYRSGEEYLGKRARAALAECRRGDP